MGCYHQSRKRMVVVPQKIYKSKDMSKTKACDEESKSEKANLLILQKGGTMHMTKMGTIMKIHQQNFLKSKMTPVEEDYEILNKIGSGAYGQVFKVRQKSNDMVRAMKIINKIQSKKFFENDENALFEGDYLKRLDHSNIIKMYDSYVTENDFYLILEFINGGELYDTIIGFKNFTEKIASKLMYQLLSAIAYLHDKSLVHRDIKPENILIEASEMLEKIYKQKSQEKSNAGGHFMSDVKIKDTMNSYVDPNNSFVNTLKGENINLLLRTDQIDFNLVLIDFGACTYLEKGKYLDLKFGTPYYMAPEVLKQKYDFKCDIWSCGIIMHTLLIGHPPFLGANNKEILKKVAEGKVVLEGDKWKNISNEAKLLLKQMLEYDPDKRIGAQQALSNSWITCWQNERTDFESIVLSDILCNIKNFRAIEKFQQASIAYIVHYTNSSSQNHQLRRIFKSFDKNGDGKLSYTEFSEGYKKVFGNATSEEELLKIISHMDQNKDNYIEYEEFLRLSLSQMKLVNDQNLKIAFENFDSDKNGSLSRDEIRQILIDADEEYLDELFMIIDLDHNGNISFEEFKRMMEILVKKTGSGML